MKIEKLCSHTALLSSFYFLFIILFLIMTNDDNFIFPYQSISQIVIDSDSSIHVSSFDDISDNQSISFSRFKSIGQYFIIENNPLCLVEAKKYLVQIISMIYLNISIVN